MLARLVPVSSPAATQFSRVCLYHLARRTFSTSLVRRMSTVLPPSPIPLFTTTASFREWRNKAFKEGKSVGFVPTMGALHEGHLSLVRQSLKDNDLTVLSIFVNPAQFAPHEDLATYPRTLPQDITVLTSLHVDLPPPPFHEPTKTIKQNHDQMLIKKPSAILLPNVKEMYPSGITQNVSEQKGTFIEVKGYSHQMEGQSRPTFFRGVATVVTKLFNIIQPTNAYFGQKDIQQALLLKRLTKDLLMSQPSSECLHIVPTARDPVDSLALSSRNAYLTTEGRKVATTLYQALNVAKSAWEAGSTKSECIAKADELVQAQIKQLQEDQIDVEMRLDFIEINDPDTFDVVENNVTKKDLNVALLSGALFVGKTRLIDNLILGDESKIIG